MRLFLTVLFLQLPIWAAPDWDQLLSQLNAAEFAHRDAATDTLKIWAHKHPDQALVQFPRHIATAPGPEAQQRLTHILREIYLPKNRALYGFQFLAQRHPAPGGGTRTILKVQMVVKGTAAARDGLRSKDQIIALNGKPIDPKLDDESLLVEFARHQQGKPTTFHIMRAGKKIKLELTPSAREFLPEEKKQQMKHFQRWLAKEIAEIKAQH